MPTAVLTERAAAFACFGGTVRLRAAGPAAEVDAALAAAQELALEVHRRLTRFDAASELSRLNADARTVVPASRVLRDLVRAARWAGGRSGGLVDATCLPALEAAGYRDHWEPGAAFAAAPAPPAPGGGWRRLVVLDDAVVRPGGVRIDSGGLAKGLAADLLAERLHGLDAWLVDCGGDLRLGGTRHLPRRVDVADPWSDDAPLTTFRLRAGAVATSGTTRRAWSGGHHLIDPRTGRPADTGVVQVTALAPTALEAEVLAKAALLSGRAGAAGWLVHGGAYVTDDHALHLLPPTSEELLP